MKDNPFDQNQNRLRMTVMILCVFSLISSRMIHAQSMEPPNAPAVWTFENNAVRIAYADGFLFEGVLETDDPAPDFNHLVDDAGPIHQILKWTSRRAPIRITGRIMASGEAFPCESDRRRSGPDIVRHSIGLSRSRLNRAVYDRRRDCVLSVDYPADVIITPDKDDPTARTFTIEITGRTIILRFRPRYYQKHRGLDRFKSWTTTVWQKPVVGWCSWFAYFTDITEDHVKHTADVLSETLVPFGLEYLQIDDGYQQVPAGMPDTWLKPNEKFPSGLNKLSRYITQRGLKPGIWTYTSFLQKEEAFAHRDLFVLNKGEPAYGNWVGYIMDGSNPEIHERILKPLYGGLVDMGWQYFKVDALRHLRYEGYNSHTEYFKERGVDLMDAYIDVVQTIRDQIGPDRFMLGCWGIRPELTGLIDGCRIGGDGFGYAGLAQYNSFNNVVWRNDPDHIELSEQEAYRSSMVTSLTGSLFMLTDKPEVYLTDRIEPARRTIPVPFTLPGQIFDVDPSRSMHIRMVDSELSGDGERFFDADRTPRCHLFLLEINTSFEGWMVLGRTGGGIDRIQFKHLGLSDVAEYLIFEFWSKTFLGAFHESFPLPPIDCMFNCQLFSIRESKPHPQIVATSRHVTCGGVDLENVLWEGQALSGKSRIVGKDDYILYILEPSHFVFKQADCHGARIDMNEMQGGLRTIRLVSDYNAAASWTIHYDHEE